MSITDRAVRALQGAQRFTQAVEGLLIDNISAISPWLAPLIPASLTYQGMIGQMGFPQWVALAGAGTVELVGLAAINTVFVFYDYNRTRRKVDSTAPVWVALFTAAFYLGIVLTVNVLMDNSAPEIKLGKGLLSSLSVCSGVVIALRAGHSRRLRGIEQDREDRREARAQVAAQVADRPPVAVQIAAQMRYDWRKMDQEEREHVRSMPTPEIMASYGVSERTAQYWKSRSNGHKV